MADLKHHVQRQLESARNWLLRAEDSFGKDHKIRGELDLLLAQAELQHAQETSRSGQWRLKYPLLRHGLAVFLAFAILSTGVGGAYWLFSLRSAAVPVPLTVRTHEVRSTVVGSADRMQPEPAAAAPNKTMASPPAAVAAAPAVPPTMAPAVKQKDHSQGTSTPKDVAVSPDEMQKLMRAAGKSLRGQ